MKLKNSSTLRKKQTVRKVSNWKAKIGGKQNAGKHKSVSKASNMKRIEIEKQNVNSARVLPENSKDKIKKPRGRPKKIKPGNTGGNTCSTSPETQIVDNEYLLEDRDSDFVMSEIDSDDNDVDYNPESDIEVKTETPGYNVRRKTSNVTYNNDILFDEVDVNEELEFLYEKRKNKKLGRPPKCRKQFRCIRCDFSTYDEVAYKRHRFKYHPILHCQFCQQTFKAKNTLLMHMAKKHTGVKYFQCPVDGCDYATKDTSDLRRHQSKHATEKSYVCSLCGWKTKWQRNLRSHHLMKHSTTRKFKCDQCSFACKRSTDLKQHKFRHTEEKPLSCTICGFKVKTNWEIRSHMLSHSDVKPFKCQFPGCTEARKTNADLVKHQVAHKTVRDHKCEICGKDYKCRQSLRKHKELMHTEGLKLNCDKCGKSFKSKVSLRKHLENHTGVKRHECKVCGHKFFQQSNMKVHLKTHERENRPFSCPLCPHTSRQFDHLLVHIGSVHQDFTFFCEICRKPFKRHHCLQTHYRRMHKSSEIARLGMAGNVDAALVQMEMELDKEEEEYRKRKERKKCYQDNNGYVRVKTEPEDDGYENSNTNCTVIDQDRNNDLQQGRNEERSETVMTTSSNGSGVGMEEAEIEADSIADRKHRKPRVTNSKSKVSVGKEVANEGTSIDYSDSVTQGQGSLDNCITPSGKPYVSLSLCGKYRLSLATKGFKFNYEKTGKKPKCWFMDVNLMEKKDAEKQKLYLRRRGYLPPLPRGHPPKGYKKLSSFLKKRRKMFEEQKQKAAEFKESRLKEGEKNMARTTRFQGKYSELADSACSDDEAINKQSIDKDTCGEDEVDLNHTQNQIEQESESTSTSMQCVNAQPKRKRGRPPKKNNRTLLLNDEHGKATNRSKLSKTNIEKDKSSLKSTPKSGKQKQKLTVNIENSSKHRINTKGKHLKNSKHARESKEAKKEKSTNGSKGKLPRNITKKKAQKTIKSKSQDLHQLEVKAEIINWSEYSSNPGSYTERNSFEALENILSEINGTCAPNQEMGVTVKVENLDDYESPTIFPVKKTNCKSSKGNHKRLAESEPKYKYIPVKKRKQMALEKEQATLQTKSKVSSTKTRNTNNSTVSKTQTGTYISTVAQEVPSETKTLDTNMFSRNNVHVSIPNTQMVIVFPPGNNVTTKPSLDSSENCNETRVDKHSKVSTLPYSDEQRVYEQNQANEG